MVGCRWTDEVFCSKTIVVAHGDYAKMEVGLRKKIKQFPKFSENLDFSLWREQSVS